MQRIGLPVIAVLIGVLCPAAVGAQQSDTTGALPVHLDVRSSDSSMATFARKLLELSLTDVKTLQLRTDSPNPCTALSVPNRAQAQQQSPKAYSRPEAETGRFAILRVILDEQRPEGRVSSPDWLIDYQLTEGQWSNGRAVCSDTRLLNQTQRTAQSKLLDALSIVGRIVASSLAGRSAVPGISVRVAVRQGRNVSADLADDVSAFLASRIAATREFRPVQRDVTRTTDYTLDVDISLSSSRTDDPRSTVSGRVTVRSDTAPAAPIDLTPQPANTLPDFYSRLADRSIQRLYEARAAADLSLNRTTLQGTSSDLLVSKAKTLLCIDVTDPKCQVQANAALAVLGQLPASAGVDEQRLIGRAQAAAGRSLDGARTFDRILESASLAPDVRLDALLRAGDAYASGREYDRAAMRYATWLMQADQAKVADDQLLDVALKQAQALRIGHANDGAIDALMFAAGRWPNARVEQELGRLVPELAKPQLVNLLARLATVRPSNQFTSVRIRASRRLASEHLRDGNYPEAEPVLKAVVAADASKQVNVDLAQLYHRWAQSAAQADARKKELLEWGVTAVEPAVRARNPNADEEFRLLNHDLGTDKRTQAEFERMLAEGAADPGALLTLMFVCNEYVFDFDCANNAATALERIAPGRDSLERQTNIFEVKVVHGDLGEAAALRDRLANDPAAGEYRPIVTFYSAWIDLATGNRGGALKAAGDWRREMEAVRTGKSSISWIFGGARRALGNPKGLSREDAAFLLSMIAAMENPALPIPELPRT